MSQTLNVNRTFVTRIDRALRNAVRAGIAPQYAEAVLLQAQQLLREGYYARPAPADDERLASLAARGE